MRRIFINKKSLILVLVLLLIMMTLFYYIADYLNTIFIEIAEIKARELVSDAITKVIKRESSKINVGDLIHSNDKNSSVNYVQIDTLKINQIGSTISDELQIQLDKNLVNYIKVPVLSALGFDLLAGFGPDLKVKIIPVGYSMVPQYEDKIENAGINNVRHKIYMLVSAEVKLIVPFKEKTIVIKTKAPMVDIVLKGEVPDKYMNFNF